MDLCATPTLAGDDAIQLLQREKLAAMLREVLGHNSFYQRKLSTVDFDPASDPMDRLPLTTRKELEADQAAHPPYGTNLTYPLHDYCRYHQTSGSAGRPLRWLDTAQSWSWFTGLWREVFGAAAVKAGDRVMFPFSFGPFIGFWGGFDAAVSRGCLAIPAGGMSTSARLRMLMDNGVEVICCTPTYALHMAEVARGDRIDLGQSAVRKIIVAGESGGSVAETKSRIERGWEGSRAGSGDRVRVFDHSGMTEVGAVSFECIENPGGVHVIESEFIAEMIDPVTLAPLSPGQTGELVLTNLGRWGSPLIRYRTGDLVRLVRATCACGRTWARLEGGILGRIDDMVTIRGNNVFPSAIEAIIRKFPEIAEFRVEICDRGGMADVRIELEPAEEIKDFSLAQRVGHTIHDTLLFKARVETVPCGTLPRFEMKAKRFVRRRA